MEKTNAKLWMIPEDTTVEDLEMDFDKALVYGDSVLVAGYYYRYNEKSYYAAIYKFQDDEHNAESPIALVASSDYYFEDEGHAIEWAIKNC